MRAVITRGFSLVEDAVYVALGILLAASAVAMLRKRGTAASRA